MLPVLPTDSSSFFAEQNPDILPKVITAPIEFSPPSIPVFAEPISLTEVSSFIDSELQKSRVIWFHTAQENNTNFAIDTYVEYFQSFGGMPIDLDAGQDLMTLIWNWDQLVKTLCPQMQPTLKDNFGEIDEVLQRKKHLFIVKNVKMNHLPFLRKLTKKIGSKFLIVSEKRLHATSVTIQFDNKSMRSMINKESSSFDLVENFFEPGSFSKDPLLLSIAIAVHKDYPETWYKYIRHATTDNFFELMMSFIQKSGQPIDFSQICLLASGAIKKDFFVDQTFLKVLVHYKLIKVVHDDWIEIPHKIQQDMERIVAKWDVYTIAEQALRFENYLCNSVNAGNQWVIPHVKHLFKIHQKHFPQTTILPLFCLMASIGHFYTQFDHKENIGAIAAKKISIQARNAIEKIVTGDNSANIFITTSPKELIEKMEQICPTLGHLYVYLQYQIGRIYFYTKDPFDFLGSKNILIYAKELAKHLIYDRKQTLLLKLIDRNGLLFHENLKQKLRKSRQRL